MTGNKSIELYIHIPFCVKKCNYCDFLSFPADEDTKEKYVKALISQIESEADAHEEQYKELEVSSIYFGGGTPSVLSTGQLERIIGAIKEKFNVADLSENTIEINPKTANKEKIETLGRIGFNRVSIGMQSSHDEELKMLGRIHSYDDFTECFNNCRSAGFKNINVDIMTALPNQTKEILEETVRKVISLDPEHISAYSLIIEEGTPFYKLYGDLDEPVVGEEAERELYWMCVDLLAQSGYEHYEISNFCKPGMRSRHNCGYWKRVAYLGFGLGASSLVYDAKSGKQYRVKNTSDMAEYLKAPDLKEEDILLSYKECMDEYMFLGLRMYEGIDFAEFENCFGQDARIIYKDAIEDNIKKGLLAVGERGIHLTRLGTDYGNYVFASFT